MARYATKWAYGPEINDSELSATERAVLRALCWKADPEKFITHELTDSDLMRLTCIKSRQTIMKARRRLLALRLIRKNGFLYHVGSRDFIHDAMVRR